MQTIASLAKRLDMSAEEAVLTLRKLHYDIADVETEISDDQCDMLMDVDEDPSVLDALIDEMRKKEAQAEKRKEQLRKNAQKAAAKRKPAPVKGKGKKPGAADEGDEDSSHDLDGGKAPIEAEILAEHAAGDEDAEDTSSEETRAAHPPEGAPESPAHKPAAEIFDGTAPVVAPVIERPRPTAEILEDDPEGMTPLEPSDESYVEGNGEGGALARAERRQEETDRKRRLQKEARPLPTPDPAVVAEVIRRAQEKEQMKNRAAVRPQAQMRTRPEPDQTRRREPRVEVPVVVEVRDIRDIQEGAGRGGPARKAPGKAPKKKPKRTERAKVLEDLMRRDAAAAVRGVQAGVDPASPKKRKKKKLRTAEEMAEERISSGTIEVENSMTVEELARSLEVDVSDVIIELMEINIIANKNQLLDIDVIRTIAEGHNYDVRAIIPEIEGIFKEEPDDPADLTFRPPVITVMGHVDHGKTSFLDVVRKANVVQGEAGGITQHIAAYDVELEQGRIVFLDTPGHEAFTQMRARGTQVTDVVVLVVAADDGVKPQTVEAIDHAKAAEVPIVVAINKCDKPGAQPDRVRQELVQYGLVDENWGGKTIIKEISCHTRQGIDELLEMLVLTSQMMELKANANKRARGAIVESELTKGQGAIAWVLVQTGTLRVGDIFLAGESYGRVRTMTNSRGQRVKEVGPATPVAVTGFNEPPDAGDVFVVVEDERIAREVSNKRMSLSRQKRGAAAKHMTLEDFHARMLASDQKILNVIVKGDVQGSTDVMGSSLAKLGNEEVRVSVVHAGVGGINESDILLASASDAVIIGFHVTANAKVQQLAAQEGVDMRTYLVIYEAIEEVRKALEGMLTPDQKEIVTGHAEVRQVFRSSAVGNIAGSFQLDGETTRGSLARVIRNDVVVQEGKIATVRREKDDVKTVSAGYECGLKLERFDDIQVGDVIECYRIEAVAKTLAG
ncbi:MAG: translation initiation factor IF-2 [Candidatus Hydrogenedentes bacterium]|nr:translation initiation factor IF-2 [Candidatus Hydrogenedentota bacterium]